MEIILAKPGGNSDYNVTLDLSRDRYRYHYAGAMWRQLPKGSSHVFTQQLESYGWVVLPALAECYLVEEGL